MAKRLKEFPGGPTRGRYPWEEWLDGSVWQLRKDEDYSISTASMRAAASRAAKAAGKRLQSRITKDDDGEGLVIQAHEIGATAPS